MPIDDVKTPVAVTTGTVIETAHPATGGEVVTEAAPDGAGGTTPLTPTATAGAGAHVGEDVNIVGGSVTATIGGTVATTVPVDVIVTGSLTASTVQSTASAPSASTTSIVCSSLLSGKGSVVAHFSGTYSVTTVAEVTTDATGATGWTIVPVETITLAGTRADGTTSINSVVSMVIFPSVAGFGLARIRASAFISGTLVVALVVSAAVSARADATDKSVQAVSSNVASVASKLSFPIPDQTSASGTMSAQNDLVYFWQLGTGWASAVVRVIGTWVGTISFTYATSDGNPSPLAMTPLDQTTGLPGAPVTSTTTNGVFVADVGGYAIAQAVMTAYTSGTAALATEASVAPRAAAIAALAAQLPAALAAHGGLKIEGVASGVAIPITAASLPALSGTTAVSLASAPTTAVTAVGGGALATDAHMGGGLPAALGAGGGLKIDGSGTTLPVSMAAAPTGAALEAGHLATIDSHTPALGQALAAASVPVVLTAIQAAQLAQEAGNLAAILAALKTAGGSAVPSLGTTATGSLTLATGPVRVTAGSTGAIVLAGAANRRVFGLVSTYNPNQSVGVIVVVTIGTPAGSYPNLTNVLHAFALTAGNSGTPIYFGSVGGYPLPNGTDLYAMATTVATAQTDPTNEPFVNVIYGP